MYTPEYSYMYGNKYFEIRETDLVMSFAGFYGSGRSLTVEPFCHSSHFHINDNVWISFQDCG